MTELQISIMLTNEMLGSQPANKQLFDDFVAANAPDAETRKEEIERMGAQEYADKTLTVFPRDEQGRPCMLDYQIKGLFKEACGMLCRADKTRSKTLRAYKKEIDGLIFVTPRYIELELPEGAEVGRCQRPLRASTPQGDRVALANSETVPAGTRMGFKVVTLKDALVPLIVEWLAYGEYHGNGQWRNSGKGTFKFEAKDGKGKVVASNMDLDDLYAQQLLG